VKWDALRLVFDTAALRFGFCICELRIENLKMKLKNCFAAAMLASAISTNAQPAKITVDAAHPRPRDFADVVGNFFEDINMSTDGAFIPNSSATFHSRMRTNRQLEV